MHSYLKETIWLFQEYFYRDERCIGMYLFGSGGKGCDDEYSDVDIGLVIKDKDYEIVKKELYPICEKICGQIHLWFPEGEQKDFVNFAFLFEKNNEQFLYDFSIMSEHHLLSSQGSFAGTVLFDHSGILHKIQEREPNNTYTPDKLNWTIEQYWIYTYLNGKYYKRFDRYKMLYIQDFLFQNHMRMLKALYPDQEWGWWPVDIKKLPAKRQEEMMAYFTAPEIDSIINSLERQITLFSEDAKNACAKWSLVYPEELENYVRKHLGRMGLLSLKDDMEEQNEVGHLTKMKE